MSVALRPLTAADREAAKQVILGVAARAFDPNAPAAFIDRWWLRLTDVDDAARVYGPPRGLFLVATDGDTLIGTGAIRPYDEATAELKRLYLLEEYHGQGIGYRLTAALLSFAVEVGYRRVRLTTDVVQARARRFYERLGFRPIPTYNEGDDDDDVALEMGLRPVGRWAGPRPTRESHAP